MTCNKGHLYFDFHEIERYVVYCTNCKYRNKMISDAIFITIPTPEKLCDNEKCKAKKVTVELENPFLSGETTYTGCLFCDDCLN